MPQSESHPVWMLFQCLLQSRPKQTHIAVIVLTSSWWGGGKTEFTHTSQCWRGTGTVLANVLEMVAKTVADIRTTSSEHAIIMTLRISENDNI